MNEKKPMKKNTEIANHYRISQADILAIDTLIKYLQYGVLSILKNHPIKTFQNASTIALDEYEAHLEQVQENAKNSFTMKGDDF